MSSAAASTTTLGAALRRAGVDVDRARLHTLAAQALRDARGASAAAQAALVECVRADAGLLRALVGDAEIARSAAALLDFTARDMRGQGLRGGGRAESAVDGLAINAPTPHSNDAAPSRGGPAGKVLEALPGAASSVERGGHIGSAHKARVVLPPRSPLDAVGGHPARASQAGPAVPSTASTAHDGPGRGHRAKAAADALPAPVVARRPNPARGLAAMAAAQAPLVRSVMDTFRLGDGRAIGDVCWGEINGLIRDNGREGRVLRAIRLHIADAPADALVREIVRAGVIEAALAEVPENV